MAEEPLDCDCWQFHIGVLTGGLRALGATTELFQSLQWIREHVIEGIKDAEADAKMEALFSDAEKKKPKDKIKRVLTDLDRAKLYVCRVERGMVPRDVADLMPLAIHDNVISACYNRNSLKEPTSELLTAARAWLAAGAKASEYPEAEEA